MITIDPDVFSFDEDLYQSLETFAVTGDFDPEVVVAALNAASERFFLVDEQGVVYPTYESMDPTKEWPAPSYVSDPEVTAEGVQVYVDCKGSIEPAVAEEFKVILTEELGKAVDVAHVVAVRYDPDSE